MKSSLNKKASQSNANHPLQDSAGCIVNMYKHVPEGEAGAWGCMVRGARAGTGVYNVNIIQKYVILKCFQNFENTFCYYSA